MNYFTRYIIISAHRNGVLCLGTVITEWKDGAILCSNLFSNEAAVDAAVDKLIQLAVYYKFDGWLINIENPIQVYTILYLNQIFSIKVLCMC